MVLPMSDTDFLPSSVTPTIVGEPVKTDTDTLTATDLQSLTALGYQLAAKKDTPDDLKAPKTPIEDADYWQLINAYGKRGADALVQGMNQYDADKNASRTWDEAIGDTVLGAATTAVDQTLGTGQVIADLFGASPETIEKMAKFHNDVMEGTTVGWGKDRSLFSEGLRRQQKAQEARLQHAQEVSRQIEEDTLKTDTGPVSRAITHLERFGRDAWHNAVDLWENPSGALVGNAGATAGGSLGGSIGGSLLLKTFTGGLGAVGKAATKNAITDALGIGSTLSKTAKFLDNKTWLTANALLEGGGAYSQVMQQVLDTPIQDLVDKSPKYADYVAQVITEDPTISREDAQNKARVLLAIDTAREAGAIVAPIAAVASIPSRGIEKSAFNNLRPDARTVAKNVAGETTEEFLQGAGQVGQNYAIQQNVDRDQDLMEDAGRQAFEGALGGGISAGIMQGRAALRLAKAAGTEAVKKPVEIVKKVAEPVITKANERVQELKQQQQIASITNEKVKAFQEASGSNQEFNATNKTFDDLYKPENEGSKSLVDETTSLMEEINDSIKTKKAVSKETAQKFESNWKKIQNIYENLVQDEAIAKLDDKSELAPKLQDAIVELQTAMNSFEATEKVLGLKPTESQQILNKTTEAIQNNDGKKLNIILQSKKFNLLPEPMRNVLRKIFIDSKNRGTIFEATKDKVDDISTNVFKQSRDFGKTSLTDHIVGIVKALDANNTRLAKEKISHLQGFMQSQINKIEALKKSFASTGSDGKSPDIPYDSFMPMSKVMGHQNKVIHFTKPFANRVITEANALARVVNAFAQEYPSLGIKQVKVPSLAEVMGQTVQENSDTREDVKEQSPVTPVANKSVTKAVNKVDEPKQSEKTQIEEDSRIHDALEAERKIVEENQIQQRMEELQNTEGTVEEESDTLTQEVKPSNKVAEGNKQQGKKEEHSNGEKKSEKVEINSTEVSLKEKVKQVFENHVKSLFYGSMKEGFTGTNGKNSLAQFDKPINAILQYLTGKSDVELYKTKTKEEEYARDQLKEDGTFNAYAQDLKAFAVALGKQLNARLASALSKKNPFTNSIKEGTVNLPNVVKVGALLTKNPDGSYTYDSHFLGMAMLATYSWIINKYTSTTDVDQFLENTGLTDKEFNTLTPEQQNAALSHSATGSSLVQELGNKILRYWGLTVNPDAPSGINTDIAYSLAAEIIASMVQSNDKDHFIKGREAFGVTTSTFFIYDDPDPNRTNKKGKLYKGYAVRYNPRDEIRAAPTLLDQLVLNEKEDNFFEDDKIPVDSNILHSNVELAPAQKELIAEQQHVEHKLNRAQSSFFQDRWTEDSAVAFMGQSEDPTEVNKNQVDGNIAANDGIRRAWRAWQADLKQMSMIAHTTSKKIYDIAKHFKYGITSVGRLQQASPIGNVGNKFYRELINPTRSKPLDLSSFFTGSYNETTKNYLRAIAQGFGIKVHNMPFDAILANLLAITQTDAYKQIHEIMMSEDPIDEEVAGKLNKLFKEAGIDVTWVTLNCVRDLCQLTDSTEEERKNWVTHVYLEQDGVTNGTANALMLHAVRIHEYFWQQARRIGANLSSEPISLAQSKELPGDADDVYTSLAKKVSTSIKDDKLKEVLTLLGFMKNGVLTRSFVKKPTTPITYGVSVGTLNQYVMRQIADSIYDLCTKAIKDPEAKKKLEQVLSTLFSKKEIEHLDPRTYTLTNEHLIYISSKTENNISNPLYDYAVEQIGLVNQEALMTAAKASNALAVIHRFMKIKSILALKAKGVKLSHGISKNQQKELNNILAAFMPIVSTGSQRFNIEKVDNNGIKGISSDNYGSLEASSELGGVIVGATDTRLPMQGGVLLMPTMTIGKGDAQMMQILSKNKALRNRTLPVFDGYNAPIDVIPEAGKASNEAVAQTWGTNTYGPILAAYKRVWKNIGNTSKLINDIINTDIPDAAKKTIFAGLFGVSEYRIKGSGKEFFVQVSKEDRYPITGSTLNTIVRETAEALQKSYIANEAIHQAMKESSLSVDQMAAAEQPAIMKQGGLQTPQEVSQRVTENTIKLSSEIKKSSTYSVDVIFESDGRTTEEKQNQEKVETKKESKLENNSAMILSNAIGSLMKKNVTLGKFLQAMTKLDRVKNIQIIVGSLDKLSSLVPGAGIDDLTNGFYNVGTNTLYIVDQGSAKNAETIAHELIHAVTTQALFDYYLNGAKNCPLKVRKAIQNIESLLNEFFDIKLNEDDDLRVAVLQSELKRLWESDSEDRFRAISEFIAYGLSDQSLVKKLDAYKASTVFGKLKKAIKELIDQIFINKVPESIYEHLQFNAATIAFYSEDSNIETAQGILFSKNIEDPRLQSLAAGFDTFRRNNKPTKLGAIIGNSNAAVTEFLKFSNIFSEATNEQKEIFGKAIKSYLLVQKINPVTFTQLQEIYRVAQDNLTQADFENLAITDDNIRVADAKAKYDYLFGDVKNPVNLPRFLAVALTSDTLRNALKNLSTRKLKKTNRSMIDGFLENQGDQLFQEVSKLLSGSIKTNNLQEQIDSINENIISQKDPEPNLMTKIGNTEDQANNKLATLIQNSFDLLDRPIFTTDSNVQRFLKLTGKALASTFGSEQKYQSMLQMARTKAAIYLPDPVIHLITDLTGDTRKTAPIGRLLKPLKASIERLRQTYREALPKYIKEAFGSNAPSEEQWSYMTNVLARTDISIFGSYDKIAELLSDRTKVDDEIFSIVDQLRKAVKGTVADKDVIDVIDKYQKEALRLAQYMVKGTKEPGIFYRNALAIQKLFGTKYKIEPKTEVIHLIDRLTSLYALTEVKEDQLKYVASMFKTAPNGMKMLLGNLMFQRQEDIFTATGSAYGGLARFNHYKGYIPFESQTSTSYKFADGVHYTREELQSLGYKRVSGIQGIDGLFQVDFKTQAQFQQGILRTVGQHTSGVDTLTGYSHQNVMKIYKKPEIISELIRTDPNTMSIFDNNGKIVAVEVHYSPELIQKRNPKTNLADLIGIWAGRHAEEALSNAANSSSVKTLYREWRNSYFDDRKAFVNVFELAKKDRVVADALRIMTPQTKQMIKEVFGEGEFWVRRDQLDDVLGYRVASVGDLFTDVNRLNPKVAILLKQAATGFGLVPTSVAYKYLMKGEDFIQKASGEMRKLIVVKSVVVPAINIISNIWDLHIMGVPWSTIAKQAASKTIETEQYIRSELRIRKLQAQLRAAAIAPEQRLSLQRRIDSERVFQNKLSIAPLIKAGEFTTIADVGILPDEDIPLSSGKFGEVIEQAVDKLPSSVKELGRQAYITKDTALFRVMNKAVQYGDFVAKSILYDYLIETGEMSKQDAMDHTREHFVDYDKSMGRVRQWLESMGMLWFYNYKLRVMKTAMYMIRHKPLFSLISTTVPTDVPLIGNIGNPLTDNIVSKAGSLSYTMGYGMAFRAPLLNPWVNLLTE